MLSYFFVLRLTLEFYWLSPNVFWVWQLDPCLLQNSACSSHHTYLYFKLSILKPNCIYFATVLDRFFKCSSDLLRILGQLLNKLSLYQVELPKLVKLNSVSAKIKSFLGLVHFSVKLDLLHHDSWVFAFHTQSCECLLKVTQVPLNFLNSQSYIVCRLLTLQKLECFLWLTLLPPQYFSVK